MLLGLVEFFTYLLFAPFGHKLVIYVCNFRCYVRL